MESNQLKRTWSIKEIRKLFSMEFGFLENRFKFIAVEAGKWRSTEDEAARPGVYVFWRAGEVIKVGRSFSNARKRAAEHMRDDTGGRMNALKEDKQARLLLYTVEAAEAHWVAALEVFFEEWLNPSIRSKRKG